MHAQDLRQHARDKPYSVPDSRSAAIGGTARCRLRRDPFTQHDSLYDPTHLIRTNKPHGPWAALAVVPRIKNGERMNLQRLFPSVGKVIANTGNRNFPRVLHDLIAAQLPVDATHITELRIDATNAAQSITSSIGGVGISPICTDTLMNASSVKQPAL